MATSQYYNLSNPFGRVEDDVGFENANLTLNTKDIVPRAIGGSFVINQLSIVTRQGLQISLLEAFESLDIDENIFSSAIVGSITLTDLGGGIE